MFTIEDSGVSLCDRLSRRDWLRIGALGLGAGLTWPQVLQARSPSAPSGSFGRAKSVIMICLLGGPPQHETWDPKPDAPAEIRGPFRPIATSNPGLHVGELMPRLAQQAHRWSVLRAVSTRDNAHSSSGYYMLTGVPHLPQNVENARPGAPNNSPSLAALVNRMKMRPGGMPASLVVPENIWNDGNIPWPGQDAGWLGRTADPWLLHCDPSVASFQVPALAMPAEVSALRFDERQSLLAQANRHLDRVARTAATADFDDKTRQALDLMTAHGIRRAFDLNQEPARHRDRYGRHRFGQSVLLARRLVEAGVPLVQVNWTRINPEVPNQGTWDTHSKNAETLEKWLMPMMDAAVASLMDDLAVRGMLDDTLVYWMGEFGRTPKHNGAAGRDHWGSVFSLAMAGAGLQPGAVHGSSDSIGAYPRDGMVRPEELNATIMHLMGIDHAAEIQDQVGRVGVLSRGEPIRAIQR
ncbi:MAG: DUF1501 domain-containing protein [Gemmataceae bacterium]|nr:DUF1501 domain-containing protein [Gemmataceae bacterium]